MAELRATPRNPLLGLLADATQKAYAFGSQPFGYDNPPVQMAMQALGIPALANTLNTASYGGGLTRGTGFARQMTPDTREALLSVVPGSAGAKASAPVAKTVAKELSPQAEKLLMDYAIKMGGIKPITAYHGSPHQFDKFSLDKIGTGEGAQVYGHGLYFADNPSVAQQYQKDLSKTGDLIDGKPIMDFYEKIQRRADKLPIDKAGIEYEKLGFLEDLEQQSSFSDALSRIDDPAIIDWAKSLQSRWQPAGNFYKVDIPDEAVANMLLWDKPLSEQPKIMKALKMNIGAPLEAIKEGSGWAVRNTETGEILSRNWGSEATARKFASLGGANAEANLTGQAYYKKLGEAGDASKKLKELGIPGIRYLDQGSRGAGEGTMNTVLFDDSLVKILERNGIPMQGLLGD